MTDENMKAYPFEGYPKWIRNNDGTLVEIQVSPRVSVGTNETTGRQSVSIFVDGKRWEQCIWVAMKSSIQEFDEMQTKYINEHGSYFDADTMIKYLGLKATTYVDVSIEQQIIAHASNLIGWIENDCNLSTMESTIAFGLLSYIVDEREAKERKSFYVHECVASGHPSLLLSVADSRRKKEIFEDIVARSLTSSECNEILSSFLKWSDVLGSLVLHLKILVMLHQIPEIYNVDDQILYKLFDYYLSHPKMNISIFGILTKMFGNKFGEFVKDMDQESRNATSTVLLSNGNTFDESYLEKEHNISVVWREMNAEYCVVNYLKPDVHILEKHYKENLFDTHANTRVLEAFPKVCRILGKEFSMRMSCAFASYVSKFLGDERTRKILLSKSAEILNIFPEFHGILFPRPSLFEIGMEVEQAYKDGDAPHFEGVVRNPNKKNLKTTIPKSVAKHFRGSYDRDGVWEFQLEKESNMNTLVLKFLSGVGENKWAYHTEVSTPFDNETCSTHIHFSPKGKDVKHYHWRDLWNNLVGILPLTLPMWVFGKHVRGDAIKRWCKPVVDTLDEESIRKIMDERTAVKGESGHYYQVGHQYDSLAWNAHHRKKNITIEFRICEQHPLWVPRCVEALNDFLVDTDGKNYYNLDIQNHNDVIGKIWENVENGKDVYKALEESGELRFNAVPEGFKELYLNALEFFKDFCKIIRNRGISVDAKMILELFEHGIDIDLVDAQDMWNIASLHKSFFSKAKNE